MSRRRDRSEDAGTDDTKDKFVQLRAQAEKLLRLDPDRVASLAPADIRELVHELNVYQMELELQNEELRGAQAALAKSHDRYASLFDFAPVGYLVVEGDGAIVAANLAAADQLATERRSLPGLKFTAFVAPAAQDDFFRYWQGVRRLGGANDIESCELVLQRADDTTFWSRIDVCRLLAPDDENILVAFTDISVEREAMASLASLNDELERRVAERTESLRLVNDVAASVNRAKTSSEAICQTLERVCTFNGWQVGRAWLAADSDSQTLDLAYSWTEDARHLSSVATMADWPGEAFSADLLIGRALETGQPFEFLTAEGELYPAEVARLFSKKPLRSICVFPILVDETSYGVLEFLGGDHSMESSAQAASIASIGEMVGRSLERDWAVRSNEAATDQYRSTLDAVADSVITINRDGEIRGVNSAVEQHFGYRKEELIGQNVSILMPLPHREEHDRYIERHLETGETHVIGRQRDVTAQRKDGSLFLAELHVEPVKSLGLFTGVLADISEYRLLQQEILSISAEENARLGRELHDGVQQQLTGLSLLTHNLVDLLAGAEPEIVGRTQRIADGIDTANQQLRGLAKGLVPVPLDSEGLMAALHEICSSVELIEGMTCSFDCPKPVAVIDTAVSGHLHRIAQEAVTNAMKHAGAKTITLSLFRIDGNLVIEIRDDGCGFEQEVVGTGLGLRLMKYRCSLLGAQLSVKSSADGTSVTVTVPEKS